MKLKDLRSTQDHEAKDLCLVCANLVADAVRLRRLVAKVAHLAVDDCSKAPSKRYIGGNGPINGCL